MAAVRLGFVKPENNWSNPTLKPADS